MCGICGIYAWRGNEKVEFESIKKMNDLLIHRGPDDEGFYIENNFAMAMRRLSIIDLSTGKQPISNETEDIFIVFNGEIYNFLELKPELLKRGHKFKTKSDTEVILHLYEEYGEDFVNYLRGMFAVSIWDKKRKKLVLARDRIGKKPLYYYFDNNYFCFSSELNSLISFGKINKTINLTAIDAYLVLQYIPAPLTIYNEIKKLPPASILVFEKGNIKIKRYWDLPLEQISNISFEEAKLEIKRLIFESTKLRMISDVPVGAFLSGGIDSSVVVAVMSQLSSKPVRTFSIGFKEEEFSELKYAREVARMYNTEHSEFIVSEDMTDILDSLIVNYGEPYADSSALPSYYVSKITRNYVKVALNGDGGDENFAGYLRYIGTKIAYIAKKFSPDFLVKLGLILTAPFKDKTAPFNTLWRLRKLLAALDEGRMENIYLSTVSYFKINEKNELLTERFKDLVGLEINYAQKYINELFSKVKDKEFINQLLYVDFNSYLPQCLMTKMDIASMANSLEARSPLLDHKLIEFVYPLKSSYKMKGFKTKYILKQTFKDMLPKNIYGRGKMGFGIPLGVWFRGELKKRFEELCLSEKALSRGYFNREYLLNLWSEHQSFKRDHGYKLWALLMLELWHQKFMSDFKI